jgi:hypothetical protein
MKRLFVLYIVSCLSFLSFGLASAQPRKAAITAEINRKAADILRLFPLLSQENALEQARQAYAQEHAACPICLDPLVNNSNYACPACGQIAHKACLKPWYHQFEWQPQNSTCPLCRARVGQSFLRDERARNRAQA